MCKLLLRRWLEKRSYCFRKILGSRGMGAQLPSPFPPWKDSSDMHRRKRLMKAKANKFISIVLNILGVFSGCTASFLGVIWISCCQTLFIWALPKQSDRCCSPRTCWVTSCILLSWVWQRTFSTFLPTVVGFISLPPSACQSNCFHRGRRLAKVAPKTSYYCMPLGDVSERNKKEQCWMGGSKTG